MAMVDEQNEGETLPSAAPAIPVDWSGLVGRIHAGEAAAMEELYRHFSRGVRFYLCRQLGPQELDDRVHDTFLIVVQAIRRGDLREPERLMGFVRTVVRRQLAAYIDQAVQSRRDTQVLEHGSGVSDSRESPEESLISQQRAEIMESVLRSISGRDREILTRFYLLEQTQEQICADMELTETQFRLLKSRAKGRFGQIGKRRLASHSLHGLSLRKAAGSLH
jgi:RNA polymerase sigma-70 factor, ECF subfamily